MTDGAATLLFQTGCFVYAIRRLAGKDLRCD